VGNRVSHRLLQLGGGVGVGGRWRRQWQWLPAHRGLLGRRHLLHVGADVLGTLGQVGDGGLLALLLLLLALLDYGLLSCKALLLLLLLLLRH